MKSRKKPNRTRSLQVKFWVSENEKRRIEKRASKFMSVSDYLRDMALNGKVIERTPSITLEHYTELNRIGNNVNQIARRINSSEANIFHRKTKAELETIFLELQKLLIKNSELIEHVINNP